MIEMICGAFGATGRLIRPADGPFSLSDAEEKRLVQRGVARYVQEKSPEPGAPDKPDDEGKREGRSEPPRPEPKKPPKANKSSKGKSGEAPPDLSPEDPVT